MQLEDIAPGQVLEGIAPDALAWVLMAQTFAPDACSVIYRDASGSLGERLVGRQHESLVRIPSRQRPLAFDADGEAFRRAAIEVLGDATDRCQTPSPDVSLLLQRGAFLLDPSRHGLSPELLLLVACSRHGPRECGESRRVVCLSIHPLTESFSMPDPPFHRIRSIEAADWPRVQEALAPLLANQLIRDRALAFLANSFATRDPRPAWTPPVVIGAAVLVSADMLQWLRQEEGATQGRRGFPK